MDWTIVISVVVVVLGAVIGLIKREKLKDAAMITKAGIESISASLGPNDDTPGKITPAEIAEAIEAMGNVGKNVLKDI